MSNKFNQETRQSVDSSTRLQSSIHRVLVLFLSLTSIVLQASAQAPSRMTFATPEDAAKTFLEAMASNDEEKLKGIFGTSEPEDFTSGDPEADRHDREVIALAMEETWHWGPRGTEKELIIGEEEWPFPIPLKKTPDGWQFDSVAGKQEVLARRVGRNELAVIDLCKVYLSMQQDYARQAHDDKKAGLYAQRFQSTPGRQDGLYWATKPGEPLSPMGDLAAIAATGGYEREKTPTAPFMGYYFRILTAQGGAAPGGAKNYIVEGDMSGGFALLAYPAKYASSGVMTFIVNQDGIVYQKDLGPDTATRASAITTYNPDKSWTKVVVH